MSDNHFKLLYDDGNIPQIDLPQNEGNSSIESNFFKAGTYSEASRSSVKADERPLPESFRPETKQRGGE